MHHNTAYKLLFTLIFENITVFNMYRLLNNFNWSCSGTILLTTLHDPFICSDVIVYSSLLEFISLRSLFLKHDNYSTKINCGTYSFIQLFNENYTHTWVHNSPQIMCNRFPCYYASLSSGDAYSERQLTPNFELWVEIFCVPTWFHMRIPKLCLCLSVRTLRKDIALLRQYQSYISNWYINGMVFMSIYCSMESQNMNLFSKKFKIELWLVLKSWNHLSFVHISPTLVIDTSMENSSPVFYHEES